MGVFQTVYDNIARLAGDAWGFMVGLLIIVAMLGGLYYTLQGGAGMAFGEIERERTEGWLNGRLSLHNYWRVSCTSFFFLEIAIFARLVSENELTLDVLFQGQSVSTHTSKS